MSIIVGIPAFNEEKNIAVLIIQLKKIADKIIVCNDGSTDLTSKIAEGLGVTVINHEKNLGYGAAIRSIFLKSKDLDGDILVTFDADGQHRIKDINRVINPIINEVPIKVQMKIIAQLFVIEVSNKAIMNTIVEVIETCRRIGTIMSWKLDSANGFGEALGSSSAIRRK